MPDTFPYKGLTKVQQLPRQDYFSNVQGVLHAHLWVEVQRKRLSSFEGNCHVYLVIRGGYLFIYTDNKNYGYAVAVRDPRMKLKKTQSAQISLTVDNGELKLEFDSPDDHDKWWNTLSALHKGQTIAEKYTEEAFSDDFWYVVEARPVGDDMVRVCHRGIIDQRTASDTDCMVQDATECYASSFTSSSSSAWVPTHNQTPSRVISQRQRLPPRQKRQEETHDASIVEDSYPLAEDVFWKKLKNLIEEEYSRRDAATQKTEDKMKILLNHLRDLLLSMMDTVEEVAESGKAAKKTTAPEKTAAPKKTAGASKKK